MLDNKFANNSLIDISSINVLLSGYITSKSIDDYANDLKEFFEHNNISRNVSGSIYSIFIEQMNNVLMYSEENINGNYNVQKGYFLFGEDDNMFILQSINQIKDSNIDLIEKKINHLNNLSRYEMRQYYKDCIKAENLNPNSKGAGLGLIDIAKHSDAPIKYMFSPPVNGLSLFTLLVKIKKGA